MKIKEKKQVRTFYFLSISASRENKILLSWLAETVKFSYHNIREFSRIIGLYTPPTQEYIKLRRNYPVVILTHQGDKSVIRS